MNGTGLMSAPNLNKYVKVILILAVITFMVAPSYNESFSVPLVTVLNWYWIMAIACIFGFWVLHKNYKV